VKQRFIIEIDVPEGINPSWDRDDKITTFNNTIMKVIQYGMLRLLKATMNSSQQKNATDVKRIVDSMKVIRTDEFDHSELTIERY
jgi:hypothetical protein